MNQDDSDLSHPAGAPVSMGDMLQQGSSMRSSQALAARIATLQESLPKSNELQQETGEDVDSLASVAGSRPDDEEVEEEEELTANELQHTTALKRPIIPRGKRRLPSIRNSPSSSVSDLLNDDEPSIVDEDAPKEEQSPQSGDGVIVDKEEDEEELVFVEHHDAYEEEMERDNDDEEELLIEKHTEMVEETIPVDANVAEDTPFEFVSDPPQVNTIDFGVTATSSSPDADIKDVDTPVPPPSPPPQQAQQPPPPPKPFNPFALGVLAAVVVVVIGIAWAAFTSR